MAITSGTYTIGSGGDYATLYDFYSDLGTQTGDLSGVVISDITETEQGDILYDNGSYTLYITSDSEHKGNLTSGHTVTFDHDVQGIRYRATGTGGGIVVEKLHFKVADGRSAAGFSDILTTTNPKTEIIRDCIFENSTSGNGRHIYVRNDDVDLMVYNNLFLYAYDNPMVYPRECTSASVIENNTLFSDNSSYGILAGSYNGIMRNNVLVISGPNKIASFGQTTTTNGYYNATTDDTGEDGDFATGSGNISNINPDNEFISTDSTSSKFLYPRTNARNLYKGTSPTLTTTYLNGQNVGTSTYWIGAYGYTNRETKLTLRNIQKGTETFSGGTATVTKKIREVDLTKSMLFVRHIGTTEDSGKTFVSAELSSNQIVFTRADSATNVVYIEWQLVEFIDGLFVQHGYSSGNTAATTNITIDPVDLTKAFPIFNLSNTGTGWDRNETFTATITSSTNLQIDKVGSGTTYAIGWQVVEIDESVLIKANGSSNYYISGTCDADNQTDITLERSVNRSKCLIFGGYQASSSIDGRDMLSPSFTDSKTLSLIRQNGSITLDYVYYVVEVARGITVEHKVVEINTGTTVDFITRPVGINVNNVYHGGNFITLNNGLYGSYGRVNRADANPSYTTFYLTQQTPTKLQVTREGSATIDGDIDISTVVFDRFDESDWTYSKFIKIDTTDGNLSTSINNNDQQENFPLIVTLSASDFDFTQFQNNGDDLRFVHKQGFFLEYEIESWNNHATSGSARIWVSVPEIDGRTVSYIKMLWGNSTAESMTSGPRVFSPAYGFEGVWHCAEESGTTVTDSTGQNDAVASTDIGNLTFNDDLGNSFEFNGSSEYCTISATSETSGYYNVVGNLNTMSVWVNNQVSDTNYRGAFVKGRDGGDGSDNYGFWKNNNTTQLLYKAGRTNSTVNTISGTWNYLANQIYQGGSDYYYWLNGEYQGFQDSSMMTDSSDNIYIGRAYDSAEYWQGYIKECRWESVLRDNDWIMLCHENQKANSTMVSFIED